MLLRKLIMKKRWKNTAIDDINFGLCPNKVINLQYLAYVSINYVKAIIINYIYAAYTKYQEIQRWIRCNP